MSQDLIIRLKKNADKQASVNIIDFRNGSLGSLLAIITKMGIIKHKKWEYIEFCELTFQLY